jgi:hypothetical protein
MSDKTITTSNGARVARPLKVLVPIIQTDLADIDSAELPLKIKVGGELVEAKEQVARGEWIDWINKNFELSRQTAETYMGMWEESEKADTPAFSSVREFTRIRADRNRKTRAKKAARKGGAGLSRADELFKEEKLLRKLALELVDAGYRNLSVKYHPDKGGNSETMRRLSSVRKTIKQAVERKEIRFR